MQPTRRELRQFARRLAYLGLAAVGIIACGTAAFALAEHDGVWDAFQWTLDIVATIGTHPGAHSVAGQITSVLLTIMGVGTLFYALVTVTEFFVAGHLSELLAERRLQRMIDATSDHYIICGYGRVGRQVARDLRAANARYVVIDANPENRQAAQDAVGVRVLDGSPSDDDVLRQAGIERARAIVACVDSDAENIFITLTAREFRDDIIVVARASEEDSESKLRRAGADRVISPYKTSGAEMARLALHPQVTGSVDVTEAYRLEEIEVSAGCQGAGMALADVTGGSIIVGLRRGGQFRPQPPSDTVLAAGDVVIAFGTPATMNRLETLFDAARGENRA